MPKVDQIAQSYLAKAAANPAQKHAICRDAAYTFIGLAQNPKNAHAAGQLAEVGKAFAFAAASERPPVMDDFADLLQETAAAYERVGPWGDDQMDLIAARREIHEERTPRQPGQVFITPESFNKDATLGRSQKIKFAPTDEDLRNGIQQNQTVAFWQGRKPEAQAMTVDVGLIFLPPLPDINDGVPQALNARPFVELEYGSDGNHTKVLFDLGVGKRVTVVGNYISVNAAMESPNQGNESPILTIGASIGAFAAPSPGPTVFTRYAVDSLPAPSNIELLQAGHFSLFIPIPLKSVFLMPLQTLLAVGETLTIQWFDFGGHHICDNFYTQSANSTMLPIPVVGDASFVRIFNTSANATFVRLPFQLAL